MFMIAPASAEVDRHLDIFSLGVEVPDFAIPDVNVIDVKLAVLHDAPTVSMDRSPVGAALGPIYALSLETFGQSLPRYHMRC